MSMSKSEGNKSSDVNLPKLQSPGCEWVREPDNSNDVNYDEDPNGCHCNGECYDVVIKINSKLHAKIMEQCKDSAPYFYSHQS